MYNFHKVRALGLNTDIGYIPEKSNKKAKLGIECKIFLQKSQLESHIPRGFSNLIRRTLNLASPTFQKGTRFLIFLAITYPSIRRIFNLEHLLADDRMVEILTTTYGS